MTSADPRNVRDALLEAGYSPAEVEDMLRAPLLRAAFNACRPLCHECGEPASRYFTTDGDGPYWLCDTLDDAHGPNRYAGELMRHASDAIRELEGTEAPRYCTACDFDTMGVCVVCDGLGWLLPEPSLVETPPRISPPTETESAP